ncbi:MAG: (d)CMP kinase [Betaproteobacteria bacterium]|nr:(d)CMP kinase [Betaproteobacteria bacterium]
MSTEIPVIAIDGPSASGKGTVAQHVAERLGFHCLDSGALYRVVALAAMQIQISWSDEKALGELAHGLAVEFRGGETLLNNHKVTDDIRAESCSAGASIVAAISSVRQGLLERQKAFRQAPGLVAEGRDMGSVVFPDARLKIYLSASAEKRAERRLKQLKQKGIAAKLPVLLQDLRERDERDSTRSVAPLKPTQEAYSLDTTDLSVDQAVDKIVLWYQGNR